MTTRTRLIAVAIALISVLSAGEKKSKRIDFRRNYEGPVFSFIEFEPTKVPTQADYPEANAVYLLREAKYEVKKIPTFSEHIVVKVLKEGGRVYANVKIPCWEGCEVLDLKARTISAGGQVVEVNQKDIFEVSDFPEFVLYSDRKAKVFAFPAVDTGSILEYHYTMGIAGLYVPDWFFQADAPTRLARFSYNVPKELEFRFVYSSLPGCTLSKENMDTPRADHAVLTYRDLPAIRDEPLAPPKHSISCWITMSLKSLTFWTFYLSAGQDSWHQIGKSYYLLTDTILTPSKTVRAKTAEVIEGCLSAEDKVRAIHRFVRDRCRYVALEIIGHSAMPSPPEQILTNQYGDCKDLTALFISMLRAADLKAYPVLVKTTHLGDLIEDFPSINQLDHLVTAVPLQYFTHQAGIEKAIALGTDDFSKSDDYVIVDPTGPTLPLGQVPAAFASRKLLICAGGDARLYALPGVTYKDNHCTATTDFSLAGPDYKGTVRVILRGERAAKWRYQLLGLRPAEVKEFLQGYLAEFSLVPELDSFKVLGLHDYDSTLSVSLWFTKTGVARKSGNQLILPVIFDVPGTFKMLHAQHERSNHVDFDYPHAQTDVMKLAIPTGYTVASLPEPQNLKFPWGEYRFASYVSGDTIVCNRALAITDRLVSKESFGDIRSLAAQVIDSGNNIVVLTVTPPVKPKR